MMFRDRREAGQKLGQALANYKADQPVIYALPRGGVEVAAGVAIVLEAPLELLLVRKIGLPWQPELAMGSVIDGGAPMVFRNEEVLATVRIANEVFNTACGRELAEIERRRRRYLGDRVPLDPKGRVAIVVDDGIATGATMKVALMALRRRQPKLIVLAVPVAARQSLQALRKDADRLVCLEAPEDLVAIGYYYQEFRQLDDDDVVRLLAEVRAAGVPRAQPPPAEAG
jgi:predicted phosphoribosyltransferase